MAKPITVPAGRVLVRNTAGPVQWGADGTEIPAGGYWHVRPDEIGPGRRWQAVEADEAARAVGDGLIAYENDADMPKAAPEPRRKREPDETAEAATSQEGA